MTKVLFLAGEKLRQYSRSPPLWERVLHLVYESTRPNIALQQTGRERLVCPTQRWRPAAELWRWAEIIMQVLVSLDLLINQLCAIGQAKLADALALLNSRPIRPY